jgi:leucyl-tRNA synthetase
MVIQVNGKVRDRLEVPVDITPEDAERVAMESEKVQPWVQGANIEKVVARPPNIVNLVVG